MVSEVFILRSDERWRARHGCGDALARVEVGEAREEDIRDLGRGLFERGNVLIDMETFYIVMRANAFVNYRWANEECLK